MGLERRGRVVRGCFRSINRKPSGRSRVGELKAPGKPFEISKRAVWEAWEKVKANQGAPGVDGQSIAEVETGRDRSEGQPVQDLESAVLGVVLPAAGACGGDPEGARCGHPNPGGAHRGRPGRADGGGPGAGGEGRADLPSGLLRVPPGAFRARRGGRVSAAVLDDRLGDRSGHRPVLRQRAVGPDGHRGGGEHRTAVGCAVCETVAARAGAAG